MEATGLFALLRRTCHACKMGLLAHASQHKGKIMYPKEMWEEKLTQLQQHIEQITKPEGGATDSQEEALYELQGQVNDLYVAWQGDSANK